MNVAMLVLVSGRMRMRVTWTVEANRRSRPRFRSFHFTISRRRVRYQGMKQVLGGVSHIVHGAIERLFVRLRRFREPAQFPNELKRRRANLIFSRWRQEVMKGFDVSAHNFEFPLCFVVGLLQFGQIHFHHLHHRRHHTIRLLLGAL